MKIMKLIFAVVAILCFASLIASAQETEQKGACRADVEKFCKDVKLGQGRMAQCMKEHEGDLSPACKQHIARAEENARKLTNDCKPDVEKFCKDVAVGMGKVFNCLKANEAGLSPACKAHFKK